MQVMLCDILDYLAAHAVTLSIYVCTSIVLGPGLLGGGLLMLLESVIKPSGQQKRYIALGLAIAGSIIFGLFLTWVYWIQPDHYARICL